MRFDYHTQYREGFALWRSPFDRNLYALLMLGLCALPWLMTPFMLGETAYVFILCVASLGLMSLTGLTGQVSLGHAAFIAIAPTKSITRAHCSAPPPVCWWAFPPSASPVSTWPW